MCGQKELTYFSNNRKRRLKFVSRRGVVSGFSETSQLSTLSCVFLGSGSSFGLTQSEESLSFVC